MVRDRIEAWVSRRTAADGDEGGLVASLRVLEELGRVQAAVGSAREALGEALALEAVLVDLRHALLSLDQVLGIRSDDAVLDRVFSTFCVGK
jgi:tRNA modification GTPase